MAISGERAFQAEGDSIYQSPRARSRLESSRNIQRTRGCSGVDGGGEGRQGL